MIRFRTHFIPEVLAHVAARGGDPAALLFSAGLPRDAAAQPFVEVSLAALHAFLDDAARTAADDALGLHSAGFTKLENEQWSALAQGGVRFHFPKLALTVVAAVGVGYGPYSVRATNRDDAIGAAAVSISKDNLGTTPIVVDFELSLGWAF